ncbi:damage-inducible protein CinA [Rhizobium rhizosphaerae]|uniref:Damage-inducible protein CinA n=1 Tax=Xaviernesmea rhizosphaerae TaxID=1672749 RepID=A0A1Q9AJF0_9HYPH|nr:CinA family protein [Xaviernesmea rhizosphaerae]OLP55314.1 damage-inducible protein CinA [Xaviernesmea rhizosphaerae]
MSLFPEPLERLAAEVIATYAARGLMVATAESCTGGLIAGLLTDVAGSSKVVDRGFVTYSNAAKQELIGVREETLARHGAVSRETALEMAAGALAASQAFAAVAVTGIAGPGGGSAEKPVGLVHLAAVNRQGEILHLEMRYGDLGRTGIRLATVETALELLVELIPER